MGGVGQKMFKLRDVFYGRPLMKENRFLHPIFEVYSLLITNPNVRTVKKIIVCVGLFYILTTDCKTKTWAEAEAVEKTFASAKR